VAGKALGISVSSYLLCRLGAARLPEGVTWRHITGASLLGGIGFTVSIFVAGLAFTDEGLVQEAKIGIFAGSILAAMFGYAFLRFFALRDPARSPDAET
jgi:NhaA family Na+:H+ antiporter